MGYDENYTEHNIQHYPHFNHCEGLTASDTLGKWQENQRFSLEKIVIPYANKPYILSAFTRSQTAKREVSFSILLSY